MGFLKKLSNIFIKGEEQLSFNMHYKEECLVLMPNFSIEKHNEAIDLINMYNIAVDNNRLLIKYKSLYDLYFDENNNEISIYRQFNLPDLFRGFLKIENINNFVQNEQVKFAYSFEGYEGNYEQKHGNIIQCFVTGDIKVISPKIYDLINELNKYNSDMQKNKDLVTQFEMLGKIKDYAEKYNIILNERLRREEKPIIIDTVKIDMHDDGKTLEIIPIFSDVKEINEQILNKLDKYDNVKDFYSAEINGKRTKFIIKNKSSIKKIKEKRKTSGEERLNILAGTSPISEDDNIDLSLFGPRVIGIGILNYRSYPPMSKNSDIKWIEKNMETPHFYAGSEKVILKPDDLKLLEKTICQMNDECKEKTEMQFRTDTGNDIKVILSKEQLKNEIIKLQNAIISPIEIKSEKVLSTIINDYDKGNNDKYIELNGKYIEKYDKEFFIKRLDEIRNKEKKNEKEDLLIFENKEENEYDETYTNIIEASDEKIIEMPSTLKPEISLFNYQKEALQKLQNLYMENNINGFLLCDDMGLGKTLQLLSFLAWLKDKKALSPSLIVAPTSLLNNWDNDNGEGEIQKFFITNTFKTIKLRGQVTDLELEEVKGCDIAFVTYESLRMNSIKLGLIGWNVMICDEAQKIKNHQTKVTVAAKAQNASFKIVCSATPIENNLTELWNLVDYSKPGLLSSLKEFRGNYVDKVANASELELEAINKDLACKLDNYYIRREKDILPKELPNKRIKIYKKVANQLEKDYINRLIHAEASALALIQKMLAVSSHVDLLDGQEVLYADCKKMINKSTKLSILYDILVDIKRLNEKAIIFVRSIKMQQIIYRAINHWFNIKVSIVNGRESNLDKRTYLIDEFRKKKGFDVIILSPDVAGFGITLTEANHVIHYMRQWNPAKEDQATDRAYRIGQNKDVTVHYPVLSFTEEKVYEYDTALEYVEDNMEVKSDNMSPEEKLNILLARKKNMLLKFFLVAGDGEIIKKEFLNLESRQENTKSIIQFEDLDRGLLDFFEFEALVAVIYDKQGYETYLTSRTNDYGVDVICIKDKQVLLVQCKNVSKLNGQDTIKDLLYAKDTYINYIGCEDYKLIVATNAIKIPDKICKHSEIEVLDGVALKNILNNYNIYKDEIDIKNNKRYSFEELKLKFEPKM